MGWIDTLFRVRTAHDPADPTTYHEPALTATFKGSSSEERVEYFSCTLKTYKGSSDYKHFFGLRVCRRTRTKYKYGNKTYDFTIIKILPAELFAVNGVEQLWQKLHIRGRGWFGRPKGEETLWLQLHDGICLKVNSIRLMNYLEAKKGALQCNEKERKKSLANVESPDVVEMCKRLNNVERPPKNLVKNHMRSRNKNVPEPHTKLD